MLELDRVTKVYRGRRVVDDVSLQVRRGEIVGLLGRNGAGKSTTLRLAIGKIRPTHGRILFHDYSITTLSITQRSRKGIGFVPHERSIFRDLTVEENLLAVLDSRMDRRSEGRERAASLLTEYGLARIARVKARSLSGGESRRLEICRAMSCRPSILMLDEPFAGVDPIAAYDIQNVLRTLPEQGVGILLTDHNVRETASFCDRVYILNEGRILMEGTQGDLEGR
jgi:lipopolysaccharide export system ATP-binding protein